MSLDCLDPLDMVSQLSSHCRKYCVPAHISLSEHFPKYRNNNNNNNNNNNKNNNKDVIPILDGDKELRPAITTDICEKGNIQK